MEIKLEIGENLRGAIEEMAYHNVFPGKQIQQAFGIDFMKLIEKHAESGDVKLEVKDAPVDKQFIKILDELFEMFAYYRDFSLHYDGDPFQDSTSSVELREEGRQRLHEVEDGAYHKGWNRFEELRQKYLEQTKE